jgi:hypothetical protein
LKKIGVKLTKEEHKYNSLPLLQKIMKSFFQKSNGFVEMLVKNIQSPKKNNINKLKLYYKGDFDENNNDIDGIFFF